MMLLWILKPLTDTLLNALYQVDDKSSDLITQWPYTKRIPFHKDL